MDTWTHGHMERYAPPHPPVTLLVLSLGASVVLGTSSHLKVPAEADPFQVNKGGIRTGPPVPPPHLSPPPSPVTAGEGLQHQSHQPNVVGASGESDNRHRQVLEAREDQLAPIFTRTFNSSLERCKPPPPPPTPHLQMLWHHPSPQETLHHCQSSSPEGLGDPGGSAAPPRSSKLSHLQATPRFCQHLSTNSNGSGSRDDPPPPLEDSSPGLLRDPGEPHGSRKRHQRHGCTHAGRHADQMRSS